MNQALIAASSLFLYLMINGSDANWITEPMNITVAVGSDVFFQCSYICPEDDTILATDWLINGVLSPLGAPPARHVFNGSGIIVRSVDASLSMNSYQCIVSSPVSLSQTGILTVLNEIDYQNYLTTQSYSIEPVVGSKTSITTASLTLKPLETFIMEDGSTIFHHVMSTINTVPKFKLDNHKTKPLIWIVLGMAGAVVIIVSAIITVTTVFLVERKKSKQNKMEAVYEDIDSKGSATVCTQSDSTEKEPVYAEIRCNYKEIPTEQNQCYHQRFAVAHNDLKLEQCPAYQ